MRYVIALDQGTTSSRAVLFDEDGRRVATEQRELPLVTPAPDRVEHDAMRIWRGQLECAEGVLKRAGVLPADVACLGITNQRETTVIWDRATLEPVANAIVWQDRRTASACRELRERGAESLVTEKTGLVLDPYFSATKIRWLLDELDGVRARAERGELAFGTVDSWLVARLTDGAVHATDVSNASRTMLMDLDSRSWCDQLLELHDVPRSLLPEIRPSSGDFGEVAIDSPLRGLPITGVAGDQQAALFGQRCTAPGLAKNTYGTGCFALLNTGEDIRRSRHRLLTTVAWTVDGRTDYALEGSVFVGGAAIQWLRDGLGIIATAADVEPLAGRVADSDGVFFVPALTGLGAPHWDPDARGAIVGLTRGTTAAHVARAALDGIAHQVVDLVEAMSADGMKVEELRVDGGATANDLLMQIQADLLGLPVVRPADIEATAQGAAFLAGIAAGVWSDGDELPSPVGGTTTFEPAMGEDSRASRRAAWQRAVDRVKKG